MTEPNRRWAIFGALTHAILFKPVTPVKNTATRSGEDSDVSEPIVTFETFAAANAYIEKNRLKRKTWDREFKYDSYLSPYKDIHVGRYEVKHPPHMDD